MIFTRPVNSIAQIILSIVIVLIACTPNATNSPPVGIEVPPGFTVEIAAGPDLVEYPMFGMIDETGRLFLFESTGNVYERSQDALENPQFRINVLEDLNGDGIYDKSTIFADSLGFPQGGVFHEGSLIVTSAPDLLKLTDTDGDGVANRREVLLSGWTLNVNANSLIGPFMGPDGWFYLTSAIEGFDVTTKEGQRLKGETSRIWRVRPDGSGLEWVSAGGMNNPIELAFTEAGEAIGTMTYFTDPKAGLRDALIYWIEGGVYPKPNSNITRDGLVRTGDLMPVITKFTRVAPSGICRYRSTALGEDFYDNLFSAQFNTHRVLRHKLFREGAFFRTEEEVFFWTEDEDFHPTDVMEDADGSLLVVETGGWFIKGCPLSQVSKPSLEGAIYRVRREDAIKLHDPYGNQIDWEGMLSEDVVQYLEDSRPFVADRAQLILVSRGADAIEPLTEILRRSSSSVNARTKAVFTLYRIGSEDAIPSLRLGLEDSDGQVRLASARAAGMERDTGAIDLLMNIVREDVSEVKRQAATALGQIGSPRAIPALFDAAEGIEDRFVEHAIIYALIRLNESESVLEGLSHTSPQVRRAALIALDQMEPSPLQPGQIISFLKSDDSVMQQTALWVTSHHPEWASRMKNYVEEQIDKSGRGEAEEKLLADILVSFSADESIHLLISDRMRGSDVEGKLFLMEVMRECVLVEFPHVWVDCLGDELSKSDDFRVRMAVLQLIRHRGLTSLNDRVKDVADDHSNPAQLRMEAIGLLSEHQSEYVRFYFDYLYDQMHERMEASVRQQAASVLAQGDLSEDQLGKLSGEFLPQADAFILPRLLPAFQGIENPEMARRIVEILIGSPVLANFTEENLKTIFQSGSAELKPAVDRLMRKWDEVRAGRLERLEAFEAQITEGDIERGREIYFGKSTCWTCHTIGDEGGDLGPDLTSIQRDRSVHDLLEAVLYPGVSFVREYETYLIKTETNRYQGVVREQTPEMIVLGLAPGSSVRIPVDEVVSMEITDVSMMPQGLEQLLTAQEFSDLMAFILGQDQDPELDEELLR